MWLVSDIGGPYKGDLFLVAHTKGIWYWCPVNCHLLTGDPHEGNRWTRHFSPEAVAAEAAAAAAAWHSASLF